MSDEHVNHQNEHKLVPTKRRQDFDDNYLDLSVTASKRKSKPSRKLRKLNISVEKKIKSPLKKYITVGAACAFALFATIAVLSSDKVKEDFLKHYEHQYNAFLDGHSNVCAKISLNTATVVDSLKRVMIGQQSAVYAISLALQKHVNFTALSLVGSAGLGKTLAAHTIYEMCQLPNNSKQYLFMDEHLRNNETWRILNIIGSSKCDENLIIIDDIAPHDWPSVKHLNAKLQSSAHRVFVIYLFNVSKYSTAARTSYFRNIEMLKQQLPVIQTVEFQAFDEGQLRLFIDRVSSELLAVQLSEAQKEEVMHSVDLERTGLKSVRAKVSLFL